MKQHHLPLMAYSPVIKGKIERLHHQQKQVLEELAHNHQASIQQILLAWSIRDGNTIAIPKSSNPDHMLENIQSAQIELTDYEIDRLDTVFNKPIINQPLALW
jgi:diketogulonate reductase-like aldo/keto reductase